MPPPYSAEALQWEQTVHLMTAALFEASMVRSIASLRSEWKVKML